MEPISKFPAKDSPFSGKEHHPDSPTYRMQTFWQWLSQLKETYFSFDPEQYDQLFDNELEKVIQRVQDPAHRQIIERLRGFEWVSYIAASVRNAGYRDQREVQERAHDVVVKLLTGGLFTNYDEDRHGPFDLRFKCAVGNAIRNLVEKERNRRHWLPTVSIGQEFEPGGVTDLPDRASSRQDGEKVIGDFRRLVHRRLGDVAAAVLDARMAGGETKSLVGDPSLGSPGRWVIKRTVQEIKALAREYAVSVGDSELLRMVQRAMAAEGETVAKRRVSMAARQAVGA